MAIIVNPTAAEFKQMLAEKKTFLADFYATWCGPCKMLSYVLEDIAKEMGERIDIVKIDIDKEPELTEEMDITIIPGLFFIKNGEVASRYAGFLPKERLQARLEKLLGNEPPVEQAPRPRSPAVAGRAARMVRRGRFIVVPSGSVSRAPGSGVCVRG